MDRRNDHHPRRLYRDSQKGVVAGVCAGIADYFGFNLAMTRVITVVCLLFAFPATLLCYFGLALLVPRKPIHLYRDSSEEKFWRSVRSSPEATFSNVRHKFRELEIRLQRLERYVTSPRFNLEQEFRDLERE